MGGDIAKNQTIPRMFRSILAGQTVDAATQQACAEFEELRDPPCSPACGAGRRCLQSVCLRVLLESWNEPVPLILLIVAILAALTTAGLVFIYATKKWSVIRASGKQASIPALCGLLLPLASTAWQLLAPSAPSCSAAFWMTSVGLTMTMG